MQKWSLKGYITVFLKQAFLIHLQPHSLQMIKMTQNAAILIPTRLSLLQGTACFTFCLQNLETHVAFLRHDSSDQTTEIMTQLSRRQCAGSSQTHIYSPGGAVKEWVWQTKKGQASDQGKCSSEWDSVLLYWSSLVVGFLNKRSLLSTYRNTSESN